MPSVWLKGVLALGAALLFSLAHAQDRLQDRLVVWEDINRSRGLEAAIIDYEIARGVQIEVYEVPLERQYDMISRLAGTDAAPDVVSLPYEVLGAAVRRDCLSAIDFMPRFHKEFLPPADTAFLRGGFFYGVPRSIETMVLYYDRDALEKPLPTLEDYYEHSINARIEGRYGLLAQFDNLNICYPVLRAMGAYVFKPLGPGLYDISNIGLAGEEAVDGVEFLQRFYREQLIPELSLGIGGQAVLDELFMSGRASSIINNPNAYGEYLHSGINLGVAPLPHLDRTRGGYLRPFIEVTGYAIPAASPRHDLAEDFIKFILQDRYARDRFRITHQIPARITALQDKVIASDPLVQAVQASSRHADLKPSVPEMVEVATPYNAALRLALIARYNVSDVLGAAVEFISSQIEIPERDSSLNDATDALSPVAVPAAESAP